MHTRGRPINTLGTTASGDNLRKCLCVVNLGLFGLSLRLCGGLWVVLVRIVYKLNVQRSDVLNK